MGKATLLYGLMIVYITEGIFAEPRLRHKADPVDLTNYEQKPDDDGKVLQFVKAYERRVRSAPKCDNTTTLSTIQVTYGDDVKIDCSCTELGSVVWYDAQCHRISNSARMSTSAMELSIRNYNESDSTSYECRINDSNSKVVCSIRTDITAVEKVSSSNKTGLVIFLILLAALLVASLCLVKKYKKRISLCMRDTCKANDGRDGKEYDAYVSTGLSETDRKFVESFIRKILRKQCGYNLFVDDRNLLPKLDYNEKVNSNLYKCRRLIVIFSPSYMTHDWCMYCFSEGLRKIVDLHVPTIFIITDHSILSELRSNSDIIDHIPQILLTQYQTSSERQQAIEQIRQRMPPPMRSLPFRKRGGMRSPMLGDAESIHKSIVNLNGNGTATYVEDGREYTFGTPPEKIAEEIEQEYDERLEEPGPDEFVTNVQTGGDVDPENVKIHQYGARKDFYSIAMTEDES